MKHKNIFWGVFLVLAAVVVIASQVTGFTTIGFWGVLASVLLVAALIQSVVRVNFFGILLSLALLYMIWQAPLALFYISPWLLILAAVLAGIGLTMLIRPRRRRGTHGGGYYHGHGGSHPPMSLEANGDENHPQIDVSFGGSSRYLHATALENGIFKASFGALEVYFDQCTLAPAGADIFVDCSFGAIELYVPRSWQVVDDVAVSLGAMKNETHGGAASEGAQLRITGSVSFGAVEVKYI